MARSASAQLRANVARALLTVIDGNRTIDWVIEEKAAWLEEPLARELLYGSVRHFYTLDASVRANLDKPLRNKDRDIWCLLLVGAYQRLYTDIPDHAVINETVEASQVLRKPWAKGLINAVLRKLENTEQTFDHPDWLIARLQSAYPQQWQAIVSANNQRAPMTLRINPRQISAPAYKGALPEDIEASIGPSPNSLILTAPVPAASLPGWQSGQVAVQDLGAQFAAPLLLAESGETERLRVLDACAAPGGKLGHMIELRPEAEYIGLERSAKRLSATRTILERLQHTPELVQGDATGLEWWDGNAFSHILLDAPCSGTGTLRRHPDIKVLLKEDSIAGHAATQLALLRNLWLTLKPGGRLLYCTCSLLPEENDNVIAQFVEGTKENGLQYDRTHPSNENKQTQADNPAHVIPIDLPTGQATRFGWQLLPTDPRTDGFYYALLEKV